MPFSKLGLSPALLEGVRAMGYIEPTPIQLRAIPLILERTRELAAQVETAMRDFARFTSVRVAVVYGGVGYGLQNEALRTGADIIVATPGRLLDHLGRGTARLDQVKFVVLDEADRML